MKGGTWAIIAAALSVIVVAVAFHLELSARSRAYGEVNGLSARLTGDLDAHRISPSQAAALRARISLARAQIERDDVLGAQQQMKRVRADLRTDTRSA